MSSYSLLGIRYGRLKVTEQAPSRKRMSYWICKCDCGKITKPIRGWSLTSGKTKSCGCLVAERPGKRLTAEEKSWNLCKTFARNALFLARQQKAADEELKTQIRAAKKEAEWAIPYEDEGQSFMGMDWTETETNLIREHITEFPFPAEELSRQTGRSIYSVKARAQQIRVQMRITAQQGSPAAPIPYQYRMRKRVLPNKASTTTLKCLGCQQLFSSWDVKLNRLCPRCGSHSEEITHTRHTGTSGHV